MQVTKEKYVEVRDVYQQHKDKRSALKKVFDDIEQ